MYVKSPTIYDGIMEKPKVPIGYVLYAVFLPVIGLFLENYASSAIVAVILWSLVLILMGVSCYLDKKMLDKNGLNTIGLGKTFLFPPVYIYKRQVLAGGETLLSVACVTLLIGAVLTNGFIKGLRVDADAVNNSVPSYSITDLDNFSGNSQYSIGECLDAFSKKKVEWNTTKQDYGFETTAKGWYDSKDFKLTIKLEYDGFRYHSFSITTVEVDGKELDQDDKTDFLKKCFIEFGKESTDDSGSSESSSR